jgi:hypothetical protein
VRRSITSLVFAPVLLPALLWVTWAHEPVPPRVSGRYPALTITPEPLPPPDVLARYLGPFRMEGAWQLRSPNERVFGYSSLVAQPGGRILAFSDAGDTLAFSAPGTPQSKPVLRRLHLAFRSNGKAGRDVESVTRDARTGRFWIGLEGSNQLVRLSPRLAETGHVAPEGMRGWGVNTGPEALTRLPDGRFLTIREVTPSWRESRLHDALLFAGDPIDDPAPKPFRFDGPDNFSVVDMAMLPDGRALILMRRLLWPAPMRFAGRIVIADTARIRPGGIWHSAPLASLASTLPIDNFEAIAAVPRRDGRVTVWLMSDDNAMRVLQRTLLWKLSVDPKELPWPK